VDGLPGFVLVVMRGCERGGRLFYWRDQGTRGKILGIESLMMAPIQHQSAEIHALDRCDGNRSSQARGCLEAAGLLGNPDGALLDDLILIERSAG
jgi:hypothetical protein